MTNGWRCRDALSAAAVDVDGRCPCCTRAFVRNHLSQAGSSPRLGQAGAVLGLAPGAEKLSGLNLEVQCMGPLFNNSILAQ